MTRILRWDEEDLHTYRKIFKAVMQLTLLFREETCVMSPKNGRTLGRFHHRVALHLEKMKPSRDMMESWLYLPLDEAMTA